MVATMFMVTQHGSQVSSMVAMVTQHTIINSKWLTNLEELHQFARIKPEAKGYRAGVKFGGAQTLNSQHIRAMSEGLGATRLAGLELICGLMEVT